MVLLTGCFPERLQSNPWFHSEHFTDPIGLRRVNGNRAARHLLGLHIHLPKMKLNKISIPIGFCKVAGDEYAKAISYFSQLELHIRVGRILRYNKGVKL